MADLRKNKERKQVVNKSLLENPDMETQANFSPYIIFLHAFILIILFSLLVMGYVLLFSPSKRATFSSKVYEGSFKEDVYYNADSCDLVVIKVYKDSRLAKKGDIVAYATNIEKGSGVLLSIDRDYVDIQKSSGEIIRVTVLSIIGKQIKTVPILGFFPAFLSSYFGVGILTAIIIVYIAIITFTRINYENTEEGKALFKQYKISQKEDKHRKSLLLKLK